MAGRHGTDSGARKRWKMLMMMMMMMMISSWGNLGQVAKFKSILAQMRRTTLFMDRERLV